MLPHILQKMQIIKKDVGFALVRLANKINIKYFTAKIRPSFFKPIFQFFKNLWNIEYKITNSQYSQVMLVMFVVIYLIHILNSFHSKFIYLVMILNMFFEYLNNIINKSTFLGMVLKFFSAVIILFNK